MGTAFLAFPIPAMYNMVSKGVTDSMLISEGRRKYRNLLAHLLIAVMICSCVLPLQTETAQAATVKAPVLKTVTHSGSSLDITWKKVKDAAGYKIQYAENRLFIHAKTVNISDGLRTSASLGASYGGTYYVRIRACKLVDEKLKWSSWTLSENATTNKTVKKSLVRKTLRKFELRRAAEQAVPGYDTLQGSCYGKGYVYYILENRNVNSYGARCKIVKVKLSNRKVAKVSGALKLSHGNDITYDTKRDRLVVAHSTPVPKKISIVNPKTLRVTGTRTIEISKKLYKLPRPSSDPNKYYRKYNGFGNIAYNAKHDQYVCCLRGETFHHLLFLDGNFEPVRFQYVGTMAKQMLQGTDSFGDYVLVAQSYGYGYTGNNVLVYDWDGNFISKLNLGNKKELESIFRVGTTYYAGFYTSFYKYKIGKGNVLQRDNYLYEVTGF